jgi:hypothetical protein
VRILAAAVAGIVQKIFLLHHKIYLLLPPIGHE